MRDHYYDWKKKIQSSVWWVRGCGDYDRKKKDTVVCLAGCAVVSVFGSGRKLAVFLLWQESFITTGKKKDTVVCLAGARSLLRPEKKKIQLSVWRVRDHYYNRKKKRYSRLSVGCAVLAITTGKKKDTVVCLTGCAVVLFFVVAGNFDNEILLRPEKKAFLSFLSRSLYLY